MVSNRVLSASPIAARDYEIPPTTSSGLFYLFLLETVNTNITQFSAASRTFCFSSYLAIRSLYRSLKRVKCGLIMIVYFTNSSIQSTGLARLSLGIIRLAPSSSSASVKCVYALGTDDWFGMVNILIHRPKIRSELTALKDCDPPEACAMANVRPW